MASLTETLATIKTTNETVLPGDRITALMVDMAVNSPEYALLAEQHFEDLIDKCLDLGEGAFSLYIALYKNALTTIANA